MAETRSISTQSAVGAIPDSTGIAITDRLKVLVVDDDPVTLRKLEKTILDHGHEATTFLNGRLAWERCQREFFPLVILDWHMPGMDGLELCRWLRRQPRGDQQEILIVTASDSPESLQAVLDAGADDYFTKPFTSKLLDVRLAVARKRAKIKSERQAAQKQFDRQHDWLEVTLSSIGDGVMTTDCDGAITFMNHEAEKLTAWCAADALGRPIESVFRIFNEKTWKEVENPALLSLLSARQEIGLASTGHGSPHQKRRGDTDRRQRFADQGQGRRHPRRRARLPRHHQQGARRESGQGESRLGRAGQAGVGNNR